MNKLFQFGLVLVLSLGMVATVSAQEEIESFVVGQEVAGEVSVSHDVDIDYYYEDFEVSKVYGQWATVELDQDGDISEESNVLASGDWENLADVSFDDTSQDRLDVVGSQTVEMSNEFNNDDFLRETGDYAYVVMIATAESEFEPEELTDTSELDDGEWTSGQWTVPGESTDYDYADETYGINEVNRDSFKFTVVEAGEPTGLSDALSNFFSDLIDELVDTLTGIFDDEDNIGIPDPDEPPVGLE